MKKGWKSDKHLYYCPCCGHTVRISEVTDSEKEVLYALWQGKRISQIAKERYVSVKTIESHRGSLYFKAGLKPGDCTIVELIRWGLSEGYIHYDIIERHRDQEGEDHEDKD